MSRVIVVLMLGLSLAGCHTKPPIGTPDRAPKQGAFSPFSATDYATVC